MKYLTLLTLLFTFSCSSGDFHEDDTDPLSTSSASGFEEEDPATDARGENPEDDSPDDVSTPQGGRSSGAGGESLGGSLTGGTSNTGGSNEEGGAGSSSVPPTPPVVDQRGYVFDPADFPEGTPPLLLSWTSAAEYEDRYHWVQAKPENCFLPSEDVKEVFWTIQASLPFTTDEPQFTMYMCPRHFYPSQNALFPPCADRTFPPRGGSFAMNKGLPLGINHAVGTSVSFSQFVNPSDYFKNVLDIKFGPHTLICDVMVFDPDDPTKYVKLTGKTTFVPLIN